MKTSPIADAPNMVLSNAAGHLFLTQDGNACHEQHLGERLIEPETVARWQSHINSFLGLRRERNFEFCFLPAPDKQSVYWSTLTENPDNRNMSRLFDRLDSRWYFDPLEALSRMAQSGTTDPYPRVDTHWNSLGALEALSGVLHKWRISISKDDIISRIIAYEFEGDLGIKTLPRTSGTAMNLDVSVWRGLLRYDNGVPDNGRVRIFGNENAPVGGRLLIIGDSFSYRIAELACLIFREVYQFHGAFIDRPLWRLIQPDFCIFEQTERFFIRSPQHSLESLFMRLIEEKIEAGIEVETIVARHRFFQNNRLLSLHQSLVVAVCERSLINFGVVSQAFSPDALAGALRAIKFAF